MLFFRNDYGQGCIPEILELMNSTNGQSYTGYSQDEICKEAKDAILKYIPDVDVDIHFLVGGTITNQTIIKHILKPYEAVIACDSGHIATHETGSIEAVGHKVITIKNENGKIQPNDIKKVFEDHMLTYEHMVYPKMVYLSNATEYGTVYTKEELLNIRKVCDELGLYLMMDGARLGVALATNPDYDLNDLASICDVFYIGGTKNGALIGEAVVISNDVLKPHFRFTMKQNGAMLAKGWLLGIQFLGLFKNNNFIKYAEHELNLARDIQNFLVNHGYSLFMKSDTNQIFVKVSKEQYVYLVDKVDFEIWEKNEDYYVIRFVTSWHTTSKEVNELYSLLEQIK